MIISKYRIWYCRQEVLIEFPIPLLYYLWNFANVDYFYSTHCLIKVAMNTITTAIFHFRAWHPWNHIKFISAGVWTGNISIVRSRRLLFVRVNFSIVIFKRNEKSSSCSLYCLVDYFGCRYVFLIL